MSCRFSVGTVGGVGAGLINPASPIRGCFLTPISRQLGLLVSDSSMRRGCVHDVPIL